MVINKDDLITVYLYNYYKSTGAVDYETRFFCEFVSKATIAMSRHII